MKVRAEDLIHPIIISDEETDKKREYPLLDKVKPNGLVSRVEELKGKGITNFALFASPSEKKVQNSYDENALIPRSSRTIKDVLPGSRIYTDVCICQYSPSGQCKIISDGDIDRNRTLETIGKVAKTHYENESDVLMLSDMTTGNVNTVKDKVPDDIEIQTEIKLHSRFYSVFRKETSTPDISKELYQLDPSKRNEIESSIERCSEEGTDGFFVKPGLTNLDIVEFVKERYRGKVLTFMPSGESLMVKKMMEETHAGKNLLPEVLENMKRAGSEKILTYLTEDYVEL